METLRSADLDVTISEAEVGLLFFWCLFPFLQFESVQDAVNEGMLVSVGPTCTYGNRIRKRKQQYLLANDQNSPNADFKSLLLYGSGRESGAVNGNRLVLCISKDSDNNMRGDDILQNIKTDRGLKVKVPLLVSFSTCFNRNHPLYT